MHDNHQPGKPSTEIVHMLNLQWQDSGSLGKLREPRSALPLECIILEDVSRSIFALNRMVSFDIDEEFKYKPVDCL